MSASRSVIFALLILSFVLAGAFAADPVEELAESLVEAVLTRPRTTRPSTPKRSTTPKRTQSTPKRTQSTPKRTSTTPKRTTSTSKRVTSRPRPRTTRPRTTRPRSSRPRTTRPKTRKTTAPVRKTSRPRTTRPRTTRPRSSRPRTTRPRTTRPKTRKTTAPARKTTKPRTQKPKSTKPRTQKPKSTKPRTQKPKSTKPTSQKPKSTKPTSQKPKSTKPSAPETGSKAEKSLKQIFGHEGKCQNWSGDKGNKFQGSIGYTCNGIIPSVGYNNKNGAFSYAAEKCKGSGANFVKCAHDMDPAKFKAGAAEVYREQYFKPAGCTGLKMPAYYLCADIAVNSGVGRAKQYLREIGNVSDPKELARKLNEKHRADYIKWSASGPNAKFRKGWLARADSRSQYINGYQGDD